MTVRLRAAGEGDARTYFLVWTTTPWTLPANLGLAVGPDIDYVLVQDGQDRYWLAKDRVAAVFREEEPEVLATQKGASLVGRRYEPPFDYYLHYADRAFRVVPADFVSTEEGTGIVHMAPGFGEDDFTIGSREGWPVAMPLDAEARFTEEVPDYQGCSSRMPIRSSSDVSARKGSSSTRRRCSTPTPSATAATHRSSTGPSIRGS